MEQNTHGSVKDDSVTLNTDENILYSQHLIQHKTFDIYSTSFSIFMVQLQTASFTGKYLMFNINSRGTGAMSVMMGVPNFSST